MNTKKTAKINQTKTTKIEARDDTISDLKEIPTGVAVGNVNGAFEGSSKQNSNHALPRVTRHPIVVVDDAQQHQRMHYDLLDRPRRYLLRFYHIHFLQLLMFSSRFRLSGVLERWEFSFLGGKTNAIPLCFRAK